MQSHDIIIPSIVCRMFGALDGPNSVFICLIYTSLVDVFDIYFLNT